jgi:6-phosphogluconolactonase
MNVRWIGVADADELSETASRRILAAAARAISDRGSFLVVLAGGQTPLGTYRRLRAAKADWSRWQVYFGDERCVPEGDAARNSRQSRDAWLDHVAIPPGHVHAIPAQLGPERGAASYAELLRDVGDFDLVLLGLGEDGHTASLFPRHAWDAAGADALAVVDAPKPPPQRVTLGAARLSRAREVLFLVMGESKREAVARWRAGDDLPAAAIRPAAGIDVLVESALLTPR